MFSRFVALVSVAALASVAIAAPHHYEEEGGSSNCSSGTVYCCNQQFNSATPFTGALGGLLQAVVGANVPIGLNCDKVTVIGATGSEKCNTQTACCTDSNQAGTVNVQCTPISVNAA